MKRTIQVRIFRGNRKYVAECLDLPVVTEAGTLDELAQNMAKLRTLSGSDLLDIFERAGFTRVSQRGSHVKLRRTVAGGVR